MNFSIFGAPKNSYVNFEIVQCAIRKEEEYILINTLPLIDQDCLISGTTDAFQEETILNEILSNYKVPDKKIIVYGKNNEDISVYRKTTQLHTLGVKDVHIYLGGMFEWMLLQDVYGKQNFPTTKNIIDILRYKSAKALVKN